MVEGPLLVAGCAALGGVGGALIPAVIRRLPEPELEPGEEKVPYPELAAPRWLPWVAAGMGALVCALAGAALGADAVVPAAIYLSVVGIALAYIDLRVHRLPNRLTLPSYAVIAGLLVLAAGLANAWGSLVGAAIGGAALWGAFFALMLVYPAGMGFGDVKLAGLLGMVLGWLGAGPLVVGLFAAFCYGGLTGLGLMLARRASRNSPIPFGPFLLLGFWTAVLLGERLTAWYLGF